MPVQPLNPDLLCAGCVSEKLDFETTDQLEELPEILGLERAVEAIRFGTGINRRGYNLFVLGSPGVGKHSTVMKFVRPLAAGQSTPSDWCYVNNFSDPHKAKVLELPAGRGRELRTDVEKLVDELKSSVPGVFESEDYETRRQVIEEELRERRDTAIEEVRKEAESRGLTLLRTPFGLAFAPVREGEVISPDEFKELAEEEREKYGRSIQELQAKLEPALRQIPQLEREGRDRVRQLNREVAVYAVDHLLGDILKKYQDLPEVLKHFDALKKDVVENINLFVKPPEAPPAMATNLQQFGVAGESPFFRRYQVNLFVDHSDNHGAPVVYEDQPTYQNLVGQVEHLAAMGALVTDFTLIKLGALHKANGGYLVIDAAKVLMHPYSWEGLKRALRSGVVRIESLGQALSLISTVTLEPEPIPLRLKVILMGDPWLYYLLSTLDAEFNELFKVAVDFEDDMKRAPDREMLFARLLGNMAKEEGLLPLHREAVARIIEQGARLAGDSERLSLHKRMLCDLLRESDYWARNAGKSVIERQDVQQAIDAKIRRSDRIRERLQEEMVRDTILIDTSGEVVGQVNGLSVLSMGQFSFGRPSRITARVRIGRGEVVDIEREVELGGPLHSKGVMILSGFLSSRYALDYPLSLTASIVFEQSYGSIEGDSASSAELYALLSALADLPLKQCFAVTGSVNQKGEIQAIGGVNEKIEGFFDLCKARGLTGQQGVLIPAANVKHLMLREEVVNAAREGRFHIFPVRTIDEGIEILTGIPAGERDEEGVFLPGTVNARVEEKLISYAERQLELGREKRLPAEEEGNGESADAS